MANRLNVAFNSLDDDELFDLFGTPPTDLSRNNLYVSTPFENLIANNVNSSSTDLYDDLDFDHEHDLTHIPSKYVTVNQLKDIAKGFSNNTFSLLHLNIRSINKHFDELQIFLDNQSKQQFSIIGLTETWLSSDTNLPYALNDYDFIVNNRSNRTGGGVALYLSHKFEYVIHDELNMMSDIVESLFIEISNPQSKNIIIGVVYRPPSSNPKDFLNCIENLLKNPLFVNKSTFIMGDFNIDLIKSDHNSTSQEFLETFLTASFLPLISKPTRVRNRSATLLDNIFTNTLQPPDSFIVLSDMTDHFPVMAYFNNFNLSANKPYFPPTRRRATPEKLASLGVSLDREDWSSVYNTDDVNNSFDSFLTLINKHLDEHIPKQKDKRINYKTSPKLPWISKSLLRSVNRKNRLYYRFKMKKTEESKKKYTLYKNILTRTIRFEKKKYYAIQLEQYKHDIKNTWKILKQAMNISKKKSNIKKIRFNNKVTEDLGDIANIFNTYFSMIGENLAKNIPCSNKHFTKFLGQPNTNSVFFAPTTKYEITDIVTAMNNKQSAGHDEISNFILKGIISSIADPLSHIFNKSILDGVFPEKKLKLPKLFPYSKKEILLNHLITGRFPYSHLCLKF